MAPIGRSTGARTAMTSAVPAGEVIARDDVFGMVRPPAATIETMIGVVRLPGSPPTQCLSTMIADGQSSRSPLITIAWVRAQLSSSSIGWAAVAVRKAAR